MLEQNSVKQSFKDILILILSLIIFSCFNSKKLKHLKNFNVVKYDFYFKIFL